MTDDGFMTLPEDSTPDVSSAILAKLEEMQKAMAKLSEENTRIRRENAEIAKTNARLMTTASPAAFVQEAVPDVRDMAYESFKKNLIRGR